MLIPLFFKVDVLKNFGIYAGKHLCWSHFLIKLQAWKQLKNEAPIQVFSCEYRKILKNSFF